MNAHSAVLTEMRLPDQTCNIDASAMARNPIIQRRTAPDQGYESGSKVNSSKATAEPLSEYEAKIESIRDIIGYCYLPPHNTSAITFEQGLCSLAVKSIQMNPHLNPLHKALKIESFNGRVFMGPINRKRLAGNLSEVLNWVAENSR
eukprot:Seg2551.4 transcript_id=Seg2551.4/GoldUCD/mRNA.D3Y31 product="MAP kinase-activated protein kinase 5" protein_id=Seg2551.4/GoldUCD/D3Y31